MKNFANPYRNLSGQWIRANFHGHCAENSGCSSVPLHKGVSMYHELGAHVMTVTDHDIVTDLTAIRAKFSDMIFINGFEYSSRENIVFLGEHVPNLFKYPLEVALARADDLMTIICHPEPNENWDYWTIDMIEALGTMPRGVEVYNGHYSVPDMMARGSNPYYAKFWDSLLSAGHRIWGFANDDFHDLADFNNAFNMVNVDAMTEAAVVDAAKNGATYGSTGLLLSSIEESQSEVCITTVSQCKGAFKGPDGVILSEGTGTVFEYSPTDHAYVRFEAEADVGRLFLQPFFHA